MFKLASRACVARDGRQKSLRHFVRQSWLQTAVYTHMHPNQTLGTSHMTYHLLFCPSLHELICTEGGVHQVCPYHLCPWDLEPVCWTLDDIHSCSFQLLPLLPHMCKGCGTNARVYTPSYQFVSFLIMPHTSLMQSLIKELEELFIKCSNGLMQ